MKASLTALLLLGPAAPSSAEQPDFRPPRLSFTAADFFASNGDVNSLPEGGVAGEAVAANAAPHVTVYQAAEDGGESPDEISSRAGPLLTLFPGRAPASHVVTTPDERRSFLSEHGKACHPAGDGAALTERHDLLASSPTTSALAVELWKYCALHVTGGVYVDASAVPLAALGDVIADGTNLAVVSSSSDVGVSPVLLPGGRSISDPVVGSSSSGTGGTVALSSFLALRKGHGVAKEMVGTIVSADPGRARDGRAPPPPGSHGIPVPRRDIPGRGGGRRGGRAEVAPQLPVPGGVLLRNPRTYRRTGVPPVGPTAGARPGPAGRRGVLPGWSARLALRRHGRRGRRVVPRGKAVRARLVVDDAQRVRADSRGGRPAQCRGERSEVHGLPPREEGGG
ncbi:hypothetical protein THAOC_21320 [Thalassiosira oceanica]|uniref:Alpha 1,4-glycosyltransferase domain-containing protein n=1 Tax=Thalassiosira oceanica TaxID=159749 RepID=K0RXL9_THAOC|nr:hypothetical protein THAOC_21320 [Thalassiosira oceanica]|eukprot:EJK58548.1 hypothetical protein THAOC_21320 [Thalassiosira oceanica]